MATLVLAHGAWSAAWAWKKMRPLMAASGHTFITPTYTGLGERAHLAEPGVDLELHIDDVLGVLQYEDLHDVVLVGHSYGGMVATGVASRARSRIAQVIYVDAFVPRHDQGLFDLIPPAQQAKNRADAAAGDGWRVPPPPSPDDTSAADLAWIRALRLPMPLACFEQRLALPDGEAHVPRAYIRAMKNERGPFAAFAERARRERGWSSYEIDASHSPNVTAPEALMRTIDRAIAESPAAHSAI